MGTVGIFDADMYKYIQVPFNLEAMKLAAYYKRKRDIVTMAPAFLPDKYGRFIYRKDYNDGDFPSGFYKDKETEYGGLAFSGNKYSPLPLEIEQMPPDVSIYAPYRRSFCTSFKMDDAFKVMCNAQHLRLSLDGKHIWKDYKKQLTNLEDRYTLFFHDYNLAEIEGSYKEVQWLLKHISQHPLSGNIASKFPIEVDNYIDLLKWSNLKTTTAFYTLRYNGVMSDEDYVHFIRKKRKDTIIQKFEYFITPRRYTEDEFIKNFLPQIFRQITFSRSYQIKILLKYEPNFFTNENWCRVIDFLNAYESSLFNLGEKRFKKILPYDSVFNFAKHLENNPIIKMYPFTKQDARDIFQFVRENNYDLFKYFYECHKVKFKGGELQIV